MHDLDYLLASRSPAMKPFTMQNINTGSYSLVYGLYCLISACYFNTETVSW